MVNFVTDTGASIILSLFVSKNSEELLKFERYKSQFNALYNKNIIKEFKP